MSPDLNHYDPNQPRDWHGRWTTGDIRGGTAIPIAASIPLECYGEFSDGWKACSRLRSQGLVRNGSNFGWTMFGCLRGIVIQPCMHYARRWMDEMGY